MVQQVINEEGSFNSTQRNQINENFSDLYKNQSFYTGQPTNLIKTSDTTLEALPGMIQTVLEAGDYLFQINLLMNSTINGGTQIAIEGSSPFGFSGSGTLFTATGSSSFIIGEGGTGILPLVASTDANVRFQIQGGMLVEAPGTLQILGAQNVSSIDSTTFFAASTFILTKVKIGG